MAFEQFKMDVNDYNKEIEELNNNKKDKKEKTDYPIITDGDYECALMGLEIGTTKAGDKLMLKGSFKILDGEFKNQRLWLNKVLTGTKNPAWAVKSAVDFLNTLGSAQVVEFNGDFDDLETQINIVYADVKNCTFLVHQQTNGNFKNYFVNDVWDN